MIDSYSFGRMEIGGHTYTSDLILFPDKIKDSWWRESGHRLSLRDMEDVFQEAPEFIVIGTGFYGIMEVEEEVKQAAQSKGISLVIEKTKKAVESYNKIAPQKKTIGAFHLTC
ncbi:MAG: Mth938-like domain-containing protein [Candidatus Aminicenantes bacterium]|nr:Mth938-like domain-containing protein [Candidatus Aminicenantes bacterium]MDH5704982.1 Mth938-like domain-containing protein [Candidatus Aminicenantes bacterium]